MYGGAGLGSRGRERARERGECIAELPVVLLRTIDGGPGRCVGLATAAARWRPVGGLGRVAERRGHQREGAVGPGVKGGDAWGGGEAGVGLRPAQSGGRAAYGTGGGKQRSRQEEEEKDWFANSENFRDPDVNQR